MWQRCSESSWASNRARSLGVTGSSIVDVEVGGRDVDVEQIVGAGELQGTWLGQGASSRLQDVCDVLGAEGLKGEAIGDGASNLIQRIGLDHSQDLANVLAGIEPLLLEAVVVGLSVR